MEQVLIDVIIPTYKPDGKLLKLLDSLQRQSVKPNKIIIMNTEEKYLSQIMYGSKLKNSNNISIYHIAQREFNHGKTRNEGAKRSEGVILVFMTQDAVPANENMLAELIKPMTDKDVVVTYARQLPDETCKVVERFTREFNYPAKDRVQTLDELPQLGIKTFFCSNVCAAYKRNYFNEAGGFENFTPFNEDMIFAAKAIHSGKKVYYASKAEVIHSHNYTNMEQLRRNFDMGASQADHPEIFKEVPSEGEGKKLVKDTIAFLSRNKKKCLIPGLILKSGYKYIGYKLGYNYKKLPGKVILSCTMNKSYWNRYWDKKKIPANVHEGYGKNSQGL